MNQLRIVAVAAVALFASTSAMALRPPDSRGSSRAAGTVIDVILDRDAVARDARGGKEWRKAQKEQAKRERKRAQESAKDARERDKGLRKAEHERRKNAREAARERAKDARERQRDRD